VGKLKNRPLFHTAKKHFLCHWLDIFIRFPTIDINYAKISAKSPEYSVLFTAISGWQQVIIRQQFIMQEMNFLSGRRQAASRKQLMLKEIGNQPRRR